MHENMTCMHYSTQNVHAWACGESITLSKLPASSSWTACFAYSMPFSLNDMYIMRTRLYESYARIEVRNPGIIAEASLEIMVRRSAGHQDPDLPTERAI